MNTPQHNIVQITKPYNTGRHVVGILGEKTSNDTRIVINSLTRESEKYLKTTADIRSNRNFGTFERGERLSESGSALLKAANTTAQTIAKQRAKLKDDLLAFRPQGQYSPHAPWKPQFDLRLIDAFKELPLGKQSAIRHQLGSFETACMHLDFAEACLRVPTMISPLSFNERSAARINIGKLTAPDQVADLELRIAEQELLSAMLRTTLNIVVEETGSISAVISGANDAWHLTQEKPPAWPHEDAPNEAWKIPAEAPPTPAPEIHGATDAAEVS